MVHLLSHFQADGFSTNQEVNMSTPPAPFANDECYRSKVSMFGPRNKIRDTNE